MTYTRRMSSATLIKYANNPLLSEALRTNHQQVWQAIAGAGDFFTGAERIEMVHVAREALDCFLCSQRKAALSPNAIDGTHDGPGELHDNIVEIIHRIRTDPGRLTKGWFEAETQSLNPQQYVEIVSVVTCSVIIDTLHNALGYGVPDLPPARPGRPGGEYNKDAEEAGAWIPIMAGPDDLADHGLPQVPNIVRALGLVPSAQDMFFTTFRPHYALKDIHLSVSQAQAEFVASRVSAINECFY